MKEIERIETVIRYYRKKERRIEELRQAQKSLSRVKGGLLIEYVEGGMEIIDLRVPRDAVNYLIERELRLEKSGLDAAYELVKRMNEKVPEQVVRRWREENETSRFRSGNSKGSG